MKTSNYNLISDKKFGFFLSFIFLILTIYLLYKEIKYLGFVTIFILGVLILITLYYPNLLNKLKIYWLKLGIFIGKIINPIIIGIVFFGIFTPYSIIMRVFGRDELNLNKLKKKSYWRYRNSKASPTDFKKQF